MFIIYGLFFLSCVCVFFWYVSELIHICSYSDSLPEKSKQCTQPETNKHVNQNTNKNENLSNHEQKLKAVMNKIKPSPKDFTDIDIEKALNSLLKH